MSGQLSFPVMLGVLVGSGCSHEPAVAASGWHQTAHSSEALGPATSVSTIERTAARNTSMLTCLGARDRPGSPKGAGANSQLFRLSMPGRRLDTGRGCGISPLRCRKSRTLATPIVTPDRCNEPDSDASAGYEAARKQRTRSPDDRLGNRRNVVRCLRATRDEGFGRHDGRRARQRGSPNERSLCRAPTRVRRCSVVDCRSSGRRI